MQRIKVSRSDGFGVKHLVALSDASSVLFDRAATVGSRSEMSALCETLRFSGPSGDCPESARLRSPRLDPERPLCV
jgi:hypothetical protein